MIAAKRRISIATLALAVLACLISGARPGANEALAATAKAKPPLRVLVFSRTTGFRHSSIGAGVAAVHQLGAEHDFRVHSTEDAKAFRRRNLRRYAAVVFLNTTGTVLNGRQKGAFKRYIRRGGGYVGIHSAADTEHQWPFYNRLVGALFLNHPLQQLAFFDNEAPRHPATTHLDPRFLALDEFYAFKRNPRRRVRVLLTIDEQTYLPDPNTSHLPGGSPSSGRMGDHPMSWCRNVAKGRSFYTALGHEAYLYSEGWYLQHLLGGIRTATRIVKANCKPDT